MGLGTRNRQNQTAEICKQHLREKNQNKLGLVEEFIHEIECTGKNHDVTRWSQFTDIKDIKEEMLKRLDEHFEKWLNP
jgi:SNF2 family DNA or RNA helicase